MQQMKKFSLDIVGQILYWCKSKPRRDVRWFSQGGAQVLPQKNPLKMKSIFTGLLSQKKEASFRHNPARPLGKGRKKAKANQAPSGVHSSHSTDWGWGGKSGLGRAGTQDPRLDQAHPLTPEQSDEQSLSGTKDICWVKQELTQNKDKARQYHMTRQSVPARCQGQRQLMHPISQEESIMLNNSVSSIRSKSVQMQLKQALRSAHCRLKSDWSPSCDTSALAVWGSHSCGKMSFQAWYMHKAGLNMDACYPSFFSDLKWEESKETLDF